MKPSDEARRWKKPTGTRLLAAASIGVMALGAARWAGDVRLRLEPALAHARDGGMAHAVGFRGGPPGPGGPMSGDGPGIMLPLMLFAGDLSEEQRKRVFELMESNRDAIKGLFEQLRAANDELATKLLAAGKVTKEDLQPTLDKIAGLRTKLVDNGVAVALHVRDLMTAEQIARAAQVHQRLEQLEEEKHKLLGNAPIPF